MTPRAISSSTSHDPFSCNRAIRLWIQVMTYLKEQLLETMRKVFIQTHGSSLETDKRKLLSSYLLYNVLHCLSEIKTPLFHTCMCNLAIIILYLLECQFKNLKFLFFNFIFFNHGETNFLSLVQFLFPFYFQLFHFTITPVFCLSPWKLPAPEDYLVLPSSEPWAG